METVQMEAVTGFFSQKTVDEVKAIKLKTRSDIERKKEELRQMVGERYRDLIEAADTIGCMQSSAEDTSSYVKKIQMFYTKNKSMKKSLTARNKQMQERQEFKRYMEVAAETKVLTEMPEKIWSQVELGNMTNASFLYLQSLSITRNLSLEHGNSYSPILQWFPMLGQQAQAVVNLRAAIVKKCHFRLRDFKIPPISVADAVCSIVMLEGSSLHEVLKIFLDTRKSVLETILEGGVVGTDSYSTAGSKTLISDSVECLMQTALQVFELFCPLGEQSSQITKLLNEYVARSGNDCLTQLYGNVESSEVWSRYLPVDTTSQLVKIDVEDRCVAASTLQSTCLSWLFDCQKLLLNGIRKLLGFVASTKDLSLVRHAAKEVLARANQHCADANSEQWMEDDDDDEQEAKSRWFVCCMAVFGRSVDMWSETLQSLFVEKIKKIVDSTFDQLREQARKIIHDKCTDPTSQPTNLSSYLWKEHDDDITPNMAWDQWQTRRSQHSLVEQGGLTLKTMSVTPKIRSTCCSINDVALKLLDDISCYSSLKHHNEEDNNDKMDSDKREGKEIHAALKSACFGFIDSFIDMLTAETTTLQQSDDPSAMKHVLFLNFLCNNFFSLCTAFHRCCFADVDIQERLEQRFQLHRRLSSLSSPAKASSGGTRDAIVAQWKDVTAKMHSRSRAFMRLWRDRLLCDSLAAFRHSLLHSCGDSFSFCRTFVAWDKLTIEEEGEDGQVVQSQIHIPASTAVHTQQLLFQVSHCLQRFGAHSLGRIALQQTSSDLLEGTLKAYSAAREAFGTADGLNIDDSARPSQTWALQSLFDLRYLHLLLHQNTATTNQESDDEEEEDTEDSRTFTFTELIDWLEGYIDPFDLDVFSNHLTKNIQRYAAGTCSMYGILTTADKVSTGLTKNTMPHSSSSNVHNILPTVPDCGRFSVLPIATPDLSQQRLKAAVGRQRSISDALRDLADPNPALKETKNRDSSSLYSKLGGAISSSWLSMSSSFIED